MTAAAPWNAFLAAFHERFPTHIGKRRRQEMYALAKQILAQDISPKQAELFIDRSVSTGLLKAADKALVMFLVFIAILAWTMLIEPKLDPASVENPEAKQRFFETLFNELEQTLERAPDRDQWPFPDSLFEQAEPAVPLQNNQPRSPARIPTETSVAPKRGQRKPASPSKKKKGS